MKREVCSNNLWNKIYFAVWWIIFVVVAVAGCRILDLRSRKSHSVWLAFDNFFGSAFTALLVIVAWFSLTGLDLKCALHDKQYRTLIWIGYQNPKIHTLKSCRIACECVIFFSSLFDNKIANAKSGQWNKYWNSLSTRFHGKVMTIRYCIFEIGILV